MAPENKSPAMGGSRNELSSTVTNAPSPVTTTNSFRNGMCSKGQCSAIQGYCEGNTEMHRGPFFSRLLVELGLTRESLEVPRPVG